MMNRTIASLVSTTVATTALITVSLMQSTLPANAQSGVNEYLCGTSEGHPATVARTANGDIPIIRFKSEHFSASGYTPDRRCREVSARFNSLLKQGKLRQALLRTGRKNNQNIVCVAKEIGSPCLSDGLLFTLRPDRDPDQTLKNLLTVAVKNSSGALNETTGRQYFSLDQVIEDASNQLTGSPVNEMTKEGTSEGSLFSP
jgi:hypothetical protein